MIKAKTVTASLLTVVLSSVSVTPLLAETVKEQTAPGAQQSVLSKGDTQTLPAIAATPYVAVRKGHDLSDALLVQAVSTEQYTSLTQSKQLNQQTAGRQVITLEQYKALRGTQGLDKALIVKAASVEDLNSSVGNKDLSKNGQAPSKEGVNATFAQSAKEYVVLPQGQELSSEELEKVEGEVYWWVVPAGAGAAVGGGRQIAVNLASGQKWYNGVGQAAIGGAVNGVIRRLR